MPDADSVCFIFPLLILSDFFHQILDEQPLESSGEELSVIPPLQTPIFRRICPFPFTWFGAFIWNGTLHSLLILQEVLHYLSSL